MPTFNQRFTQYIEVPGLIKPFIMEPSVKEFKFDLEFHYAETTRDVTIIVDVATVFGPIKQFIFQIQEDDLNTMHLSCITVYKKASCPATSEYRNLGEQYLTRQLSDVVNGLFKSVIADWIIDKLFVSTSLVTGHQPIEYGPERQKHVYIILTSTIESLCSFMPNYQTAYKVKP